MFNARAGIFAVAAAVLLAEAYTFGSSIHNCMSISWGLYAMMLFFGLLLYPPFVFGTILAGAFIFAVAGYAARFIAFRPLPTMIIVVVGTVILFYIGFATTEPTLEGCMPL